MDVLFLYIPLFLLFLFRFYQRIFAYFFLHLSRFVFPHCHIRLLAFVLIILRESVVLSMYLEIAALVSSFGPAFFLRLVILELHFAFLLTLTPLNRLPSSFEYSLYTLLISLFFIVIVTFLYCFFYFLRYFSYEIILL